MSCGGGEQTQTVSCIGTTGTVVDDSNCVASQKPLTTQRCNSNPCASWVGMTWGECSVACGSGTQTRTVSCQDMGGNAYDASFCSVDVKPATQQACNTQACSLTFAAPTVVSTDAQGVTLGWAVDGPAAIYEIQMASASSSTGVLTASGAYATVYTGVGPIFTVNGLQRQAPYLFQIRLAISTATWSPAVRAITQLALPSAPLGLTMQPLSDTIIQVDWTPSSDDGGSAILQYQVAYRPLADFVPTASVAPPLNTRLPGQPDTGAAVEDATTLYVTTLTRPIQITGLTPKTTYAFSVRARNVRGLGEVYPAPGDAPALRNSWTTPPAIKTVLASDPQGVNKAYAAGSQIDVIFDRDTNGPNLAPTAPQSLLRFSQSVGTLSGVWVNAAQMRLTVVTPPTTSSSVSLPSVTSLTVSVDPYANLQSADALSLPSEAKSPPITGTFGLLENVKIISYTPITGTVDSTSLPLGLNYSIPSGLTGSSIVNPTAVMTLTLTIVAPTGASFAAIKSGVAATIQYRTQGTVSVLNSKPVQIYLPSGYVGDIRVQVKLQSGQAGTVVDVGTYVSSLAPVNHKPGFVVPAPSALPTLAIDTWTSVSGLGIITDDDANLYPVNPIEVSILAPAGGLVKFSSAVDLVTYSALSTSQQSVHTISGPLVWVNAALALIELQVSFSPLLTPPTATFVVNINDKNNGAQVPANPFAFASNVVFQLTCAAGAAPTLTSAAYLPSLVALQVGLSRNVALDSSATSTTFPCSQYFDAATVTAFGASSQVSCSFQSANTILVTLGAGSTALVPGTSKIGLLANTLKVCPSALSSAPAQSIVVSAPSAPILPVPVLSIVAEPCLVADVALRTAPQGLGFGAGKFTWILPAALKQYQPADNSEIGSVVIPSAALTPGASYSFGVRVYNWLSQASLVQTLNYTRPQFDKALSLTSSVHLDQQVIPSAGLVYLKADSAFAGCLGSAAPDNLQQVYSWTVSPALASFELPATVKDAATLAVDAGTLTPNVVYSFTLTSWYEVDESTKTSITFTLQSTLPVSSVIVAPTTVNDVRPFSIDGSRSVGTTGLTGSDSGLNYMWSCTPYGSEQLCIDTKGAPIVLTSTAVLGPLNMPAGRYTFVLTVSATGSSTATASSSIDIAVVSSNAISFTVNAAPTTTVNGGGSMLQLGTTITDSTLPVQLDQLSYVWSQSAGPVLDLSSSVLTQATLTLNSALNESFWTETATYQFDCVIVQTQADNSSVSGTSSVQIYVNSAPRPGTFTAARTDAATTASTPLSTTHTLTASEFVDLEANLPLRYQFFYVSARSGSSGTKRVFMNLPSNSPVLSGVTLPAGKDGNPVTVGVAVIDSLGATSFLTTTVSMAAPVATSAAQLQTNYQPAIATSVNTASNIGVLYQTVMLADSLAVTGTLDSTAATSAADLVTLRNTLQANIATYSVGQPLAISVAAIDSLLSIPATQDTSFFSGVLSLLESTATASSAADASANTKDFRATYLGLLQHIVDQLPNMQADGSVSKRALLAITATAGSPAALLQEVLDDSQKLLWSLSRSIVTPSQQVLSSDSLQLALFRPDAQRAISQLAIPRFSASISAPLRMTVHSTTLGAVLPAQDLTMSLMSSNPVIANNWATVPIAAEPASAQDALTPAEQAAGLVVETPKQVQSPGPLLAPLLSVGMSDSTSGAAVTFDGLNVLVTVPTSPEACTAAAGLTGTQVDKYICAPYCLVWDAAASAWTETGVTTLLTVGSVAASEARCQMSNPGVLGVQQRIALKPTQATEAEVTSPPSGGATTSTSDNGVFSAKGMKPGGAGFFIVLFVTLAAVILLIVAAVFGVRRLQASRKTASSAKFAQASQEDAFGGMTNEDYHRSPIGAVIDTAAPQRDGGDEEGTEMRGGRAGLLGLGLAKIAVPRDEHEVAAVDIASPANGAALPAGQDRPSHSPMRSPTGTGGGAYDAMPSPSGTDLDLVNPQFQDMEYPPPAGSPGGDNYYTAAPSGTATPATGRNSGMATPGGNGTGRVLSYAAYGSSSNVGSTRGSRAPSRRVSPERAIQMVPAKLVFVPTTATRESVLSPIHHSAGAGLSSSAAATPAETPAASPGASPSASPTLRGSVGRPLPPLPLSGSKTSPPPLPSSASASASKVPPPLPSRQSGAAFAVVEHESGGGLFDSDESTPLSPRSKHAAAQPKAGKIGSNKKPAGGLVASMAARFSSPPPASAAAAAPAGTHFVQTVPTVSTVNVDGANMAATDSLLSPRRSPV